MAAKDVYRLTFTAQEIHDMVEALTHVRDTEGITNAARSGLNKLDEWNFKINRGFANAAYTQSGTRKSPITIESLGGSSTDSDNSTRNLISNSSALNPQQPKLPADLAPDMEAELERLNAEMLAGLEGSNNVILEERRKTPRTEKVSPTGSDLFAALTGN